MASRKRSSEFAQAVSALVDAIDEANNLALAYEKAKEANIADAAGRLDMLISDFAGDPENSPDVSELISALLGSFIEKYGESNREATSRLEERHIVRLLEVQSSSRQPGAPPSSARDRMLALKALAVSLRSTPAVAKPLLSQQVDVCLCRVREMLKDEITD